MAEVRLRKNFYGTLIPKVSSDSLRVTVEFEYKGPSQTLDIEVNSGKKGLWGDYDQESPTYHTSRYVSESDSFRSYSKSYTMSLSFWGDRKIEDCAVEVVIRGEGIHKDAILWDAYTMNLVPVGITFQMTVWGTGGFGVADKWICYYWNPAINDFVSDGKWYRLYEKITFRDVAPGGYLAVFLIKNSTVSPQFTSPTFDAVDGGIYQYDLDLNRVSKIG